MNEKAAVGRSEMAWVELPDDCPESKGEECPVVEHEKRRSSDSRGAALARIGLAIAAGLGTLSGGWVAREHLGPPAAAAAAEVVDTHARQDIAVLRAELNGRLEGLQKGQDNIEESLRELRRELRRAR